MPGTSVYLNVENAKRSLDFYQNLGFESGDPYKADNGHIQWVELTQGDCTFSLGEIEASEDPAFRDWVDGTLGRGVIVSFQVADVAAVYEAAQAADVEIEQELAEMEGERYFMAVDPDGYSIMFTGPA